MGEMTDKNDIVDKLCQHYKNLVASGEWSKQEKDSKILALSTRVEEVKKQNTQLQGQLDKLKGQSGKRSPPTKGKWLFTYVGHETQDPVTKKKFVWCKNHGKGCYMAHPHNHEEWLARRKRGAGGQGGTDKKSRRDKHDRQPGKGGNTAPSKLALSESLKATLVTQFFMTPDDADKVFEQCYTAASKDSGNE